MVPPNRLLSRALGRSSAVHSIYNEISSPFSSKTEPDMAASSLFTLRANVSISFQTQLTEFQPTSAVATSGSKTSPKQCAENSSLTHLMRSTMMPCHSSSRRPSALDYYPPRQLMNSLIGCSSICLAQLRE